MGSRNSLRFCFFVRITLQICSYFYYYTYLSKYSRFSIFDTFLDVYCSFIQVAVLEVLQRPRGRQVPAAAAQLCVANTHLYSNPELPDVKLWQCNALLQELEGFVHSRQLPLLVRSS